MLGQFKDKFINRLSAAVTVRMAVPANQVHIFKYRSLGKDVYVGRYPEIYSPECIELEDGVRIGNYVRLQAITRHDDQTFSPTMRIGAGSSVENFCTFSTNNSVILGKNVMVASNVFIADHTHEYENPDLPVQKQGLSTGDSVDIGDGCHIGQNACIFGNVTIGEHSVIGANAVVNKDIPPFSIAVGSPARVIKQYDHSAKAWVRPPA